MMKLNRLIFLCVILFAYTAIAGEQAQDKADPIASADAYEGGGITMFAGQYPQSFNYYLDNNTVSSQLFSSMYESLLNLDPITAEYVPGVADRWTISDDKKTFTFHIDPKAKWSDGKPITAEDVAWTFNAILNPENLTGVHKVSLENFNAPEVVDSQTIRFTAKDVHWRNLGAVGGITILPRHAFEDKIFNKINFEFPVVSGPYALGEIREGVFVTMKRRPDWWAKGKKANRNMFNFDTVKYRFYTDRSNAFEALKKGDIDIFPVYTSRLWMNETGGEKFSRHWIVKQRVKNKSPIGFQGFAMNMRRPPFDDVRVRQAMAHLIDRKKMNSTLMYNQYFLQNSYYEDLYTADKPHKNPVFNFDKEKARKLLAEVGWKANPETGILEKDGHPFQFNFLTRDPSSDKFLAIYSEDLKDLGILLKIDRKDWAAWTKDMGEFNYDMTWAAWGAGLFKDPEGMWEAAEADRPNGNNITGFKSEKVDELIERQKGEFDVQKRNEICRNIDQLIAAEVPYVLLWNIAATRLLYWNKFGTPDTVLSKYGRETSALAYWWFDEDSAADLEDAVSNETPLPEKADVVVFDQVFLD